MEYVYAALMLQEIGSEINEQNLSATLDAAGADVESSRIKAVVAALEDVDLAATQAATMGPGSDALALEEPEGDGQDEADDSSSLGSLFSDSEDEDDEAAAAEDGDEAAAGDDAEGVADEDESVEGAERPSDLDGEAAGSRDGSEA